MRANRYPGNCRVCGGRVARNAGSLEKLGGRWTVAHLDCARTGEAEVVTFHSPTTGWTGTQNRRGRCEDAPCCGCCTC